MALTVTLQAGDKAPDFSAESTDGSHIALKDYHGKSNVVLYFYPEDMTSGCTIEACKFRDDHDKYAAANTVVLGVSLDDRAKHQQFTEKDKLNFPLLVDTTGTICAAYGVPVDKNWPKRWTYLIAKDGTIIKKYDKVNVQTHSEELLKDLADYNLTHKN
jgi:peroxiredoxin Q/BCP